MEHVKFSFFDCPFDKIVYVTRIHVFFPRQALSYESRQVWHLGGTLEWRNGARERDPRADEAECRFRSRTRSLKFW